MSLLVLDALSVEPLVALGQIARCEAELDGLRHQQVAAARDTGASWGQIGEALGVDGQSAREQFTRRARDDLKAMAEANTDLSEEEAMALAVEEVKTVRRARRHR